jgi:methyl acetate hydrolase
VSESDLFTDLHVLISAKTVSGRSVGSFAWAGLTNTYYFIDPIKGVGAKFGTQLIPFYDSQVIEMRDKLECLVYQALCPV